jgi:predicted transcriptional regulator
VTGAAAEVAGRETAASVKGQCDKQTALNLTREIKRSVEQSWRLIKEAFERHAWAALGYESWESYCHNKLGTGLVRLSKELRREAVAGLMTGDQPMSNRAIAAAIGVDEGTVRNDLRALAESSAASPVVEAEVPTDSGEEQSEDERPQDERPLNEQHEHEPVEEEQPEEGEPAPIRRVTGVDGKSYTTKPESKSRRRPLPDAFLETAHKVDKAAQRLVRLTEDDRFPAHAANLGGRDDLQRAADALRTALDALTQAGNVG